MFEFLVRLDTADTVFNLFRYITFRTGGAVLTALFLALFLGPRVIAWLKRQQGDGQPIRSDGPETHLKKKGTPTMGGLLILLSAVPTTLLWGNLNNAFLWIALAVLLGFGLIGFADDYKKLTRKSTAGVSAKLRLAGQITISFAAACSISSLMPEALQTTLAVPFFKDLLIPLGAFFFIFATLVIVGAANAVNLTDGLDGLASGPIILTAGCFGLISYLVGNAVFANYLQLHEVPGTGELAVLCGALIGAVLGFLWYNAPPAAVFMGDTGSLALGGVLGSIAVMTKHEIVLSIIGGLFVVETLSVIIQVAYFKLSGGKRIFLMAPLHHHFEKLGWSETTVVIRFWIIAVVLALVGLSTLKLR